MEKNDVAWTSPAGSFKYRSAAVVQNGDRLLLCAVPHLDGWFLPGGKVQFGEGSAGALRRELREELGVECAVADEPMLVAESVRDGDGRHPGGRPLPGDRPFRTAARGLRPPPP